MSLLNIKKALALMQKELKKDWAKLSFSFTCKPDSAEAVADLTLNTFDDDIRVIFCAYPGGGSVFRAVFDKIDRTPEVLNLINEFNRTEVFFKAFAREDGFLELRHFFICYEVGMFKSYAGEFLCRLADLNKNEIMVDLASRTYSD